MRVCRGARGPREVKAQMDAMQTYIQSLMKMVECTKAPSVVKVVSELSGVKLVPLNRTRRYRGIFGDVRENHAGAQGR